MSFSFLHVFQNTIGVSFSNKFLLDFHLVDSHYNELIQQTSIFVSFKYAHVIQLFQLVMNFYSLVLDEMKEIYYIINYNIFGKICILHMYV